MVNLMQNLRIEYGFLECICTTSAWDVNNFSAVQDDVFESKFAKF